jgi:hypothetical protein
MFFYFLTLFLFLFFILYVLCLFFIFIFIFIFFKEWTTRQVSSWLQSVGMSQFVEVFASNNIAGKHLLELNNDDLAKDLGVTSLGNRKDLLTEIGKLRREYLQLSKLIAKGSFGAVWECWWKSQHW